MKKQNITKNFYKVFEDAYIYFNKHLFNSQLPDCLITMQRKANTMGYFSANRWSDEYGITTHEIALNPTFFATRPLIEVFQTIVHEQCHLWQFEFGKQKDSLKTYHNQEWSEKMQSVGLMPSSTGKPGGKQTGQKMADFPIENDKFYNACINLLNTGFKLGLVDRHAEPIAEPFNIIPHNDEEAIFILNTAVKDIYKNINLIDSDNLKRIRQTKQKITYQCKQCDIKVWGKPNINIVCGDCSVGFVYGK